MSVLSDCEAKWKAFQEDPGNPANWPKGETTYAKVAKPIPKEEMDRRIAIVNQERERGK